MYNIITFLISSLSIYSLIKFLRNDGYNKILINYEKWKKLNKLVSTKYDSTLMCKLVSVSMIFKSYYLSFIQYINNSVVKIDKNTYEVSYIINDKLYKMIIKPKRGPIPILSVINEYDSNITDEILPYLGPYNNWLNIKYTPNSFNYNLLKFELSSGEIKIFKNLENIDV